jgi:hypothetical protein
VLSDGKGVRALIFSEDGLSIPFFNIGRNISRNVSLTTTLTNPLRTPDWLLGTNRNPTLPQQSQAEPPMQNVEPTVPSAVEQQSHEHLEVAAVTIDIHDYPEASTQKENTEGRMFTQSVSTLDVPYHSDTTATSHGLTPDSVGKQSTHPGSLNIATELRVAQPKSLRTVQFSTV